MKTDPANADRLLVVKPSSLGDVIHTLPAVSAIHRASPDLRIDWIVNREWAPLLDRNPALNAVIEFPRREFRGWRDLPKARRWAREHLRHVRPDIALDFQGLLRSALMARASRAREIAGFRNAREGAAFFYHEKVSVPDWGRLHAVERNFRLAESIGVSPPDPIEFNLPPGESCADLEDAIPEEFVLLHPFSRGIGKSLSAAEVAAICERIGSALRIIIVGAGCEWPAQTPFPQNAINLLDRTTLPQLIWLMRRASWIVSVDSGPMHLAAALTGRLLSIHTWTDPVMVGPYREEAWVWRDGFLEKIGNIEPGRFPERRDARNKFEKSILPPGGAGRIAEFVKENATSR